MERIIKLYKQNRVNEAPYKFNKVYGSGNFGKDFQEKAEELNKLKEPINVEEVEKIIGNKS